MSQLFYLVGIYCTIAIEYIANPHECLTLSIRVEVVALHSYPRTYLASNLGACTFYQTSSPPLSPPRAIPETGCNRTHTRNTLSTHRQNDLTRVLHRPVELAAHSRLSPVSAFGLKPALR